MYLVKILSNIYLFGIVHHDTKNVHWEGQLGQIWFNINFKELPIQKCYEFTHFKSFQTCMTFFPLFWNTKEDIWKNNGLGTIECQSMMKKY